MSRDEVLARYPGARWREVNDDDRRWCAATGHPVPLGYVVVDVKVRRVSDGIERTITSHGSMIRTDSDDAISEAIDNQLYWFTDGNGGCESNIERDFLRAGGEEEPDFDRPHGCKHVAYRIIGPDWLADE